MFTSLAVLVVQLALVGVLIYWYYVRKFSYWSSRGVPGPVPVPLFGSIWEKMSNDPNLIESKWFNKYGKVYGTYQATHPVLTIADPELIKQVLVKDFTTFINRRALFTYHEIFNNNLFFLEGDSWKAIRSVATPSFTSGKLKTMVGMMNGCVDKLDGYLDKITGGDAKTAMKNQEDLRDENNNPRPLVVEIDAKKVMYGFTIDVIATTTFATDVDSNGVDRENVPLTQHCVALFKFNQLKSLVAFMMPAKVNALLGITTLFTQHHFEYLVDFVRAVVRNRAASGCSRSDLIQLLMNGEIDMKALQGLDYHKLTSSMTADGEADAELNDTPAMATLSTGDQKKRKLTENELVSQCIFFFFAGLETSASTLTYMLFELAHNQDCQDRLVREIEASGVGEMDRGSAQFYETVMNGIPYLDACVKETLRKYPPVVRLTRRVSKQGYILAGIELERETTIEIPAYAVHMNPEYYPVPELYQPDRFMPENRDRLVPYAFLPFGLGPRNCVGMRFAYQTIKLCLARVMPKYRFSPGSRTPAKLSFRPSAVHLLNTDEIMVNVEARR